MSAICYEDRVRDLCGRLHKSQRRGTGPAAAILDSQMLRPTPECDHHAGFDRDNETSDSKAHPDVIQLSEAMRCFVLLPRRWVVGRSFGYAARFSRLAKDYERLPEVLDGMNFVAFSFLVLRKADLRQITCASHATLMGEIPKRSERH